MRTFQLFLLNDEGATIVELGIVVFMISAIVGVIGVVVMLLYLVCVGVGVCGA